MVEIFLQPEPLAVLAELLATGVETGDGGHGPLVDPGQVPLVLLGQGAAVYWTAVFQVTNTFSLPVAGNCKLVYTYTCFKL